MKILKSVSTSAGTVVCAIIEKSDTEKSVPGLLNQYFQVRTNIWTCKYDYTKNNSGIEADQYDSDSSYIVLYTENESGKLLIGGCRIIYANCGENLPIGQCSDERILDPAVEISRFFLSPDFSRETGFDPEILLQTLVWSIGSALKSEGYECAYATIRISFFEKLIRNGVPMIRIGSTQKHGGKMFYPAQLLA